MDYKKYLFADVKKVPWWKQALKIGKILMYIFFITLFLWGCGQNFDPNVSSIGSIGKSMPGSFFEFIFPGDQGKTFFMIDEQGVPFSGVTSWAEAWTKTKSPFFGLLVYPIAGLLWSLIKIFSGGFNNQPTAFAAFFAVFVVALIIKVGTLSISWKTQKSQEKMQGMQIKQSELQAKYKNSTDPQAKQKMQTELMALYKKEGVKPLAAFSGQFLAMPFLFAMFMVIRSMRILKEVEIGGMLFTETPWDGLKSQQWVYLSVILIYLPIQFIAMLLPMYLNRNKNKFATKEAKAAQKKQLLIQLAMSAAFIYFVLITPSGIAVYWIYSSVLTIGQTLLFHYLGKRAKYRKKKNI